jgi:hypothetical protein
MIRIAAPLLAIMIASQPLAAQAQARGRIAATARTAALADSTVAKFFQWSRRWPLWRGARRAGCSIIRRTINPPNWCFAEPPRRPDPSPEDRSRWSVR